MAMMVGVKGTTMLPWIQKGLRHRSLNSKMGLSHPSTLQCWGLLDPLVRSSGIYHQSVRHICTDRLVGGALNFPNSHTLLCSAC